jgi:hypothetical protein
MFINENNLKELPQADVIPPSLELDSAASVRGDNFNMEQEIWKPIKWLRGHYEVSNKCNIRCWYDYRNGNEKRRDTPVEVKQTKKKNYYPVVSLRVGINNRTIKGVHVVAATEFIPNPLNLPEVNHKDGDKSNCQLSNFEWSTHSDNIKHAWDNKLIKTPLGQRFWNRKYSDEQIMEIYTMDSWREIRDKYGIAYSSIQRIKSGETWKHLTGGKNNIKRKCPRKQKQLLALP